MRKFFIIILAVVIFLMMTSCSGSTLDSDFMTPGTHWIAIPEGEYSDNFKANNQLCKDIANYFTARNYKYYGYEDETDRAILNFDSDINEIKDILVSSEIEPETNCNIALFRIVDKNYKLELVKKEYIEFYLSED